MTNTNKKVSIVIPCYNEGEIVLETLKTTSHILENVTEEYEIIAINDGSKDDTERYLQLASIRDKNIKVVSYQQNKGKGYALKQGLQAATGDIIGYIDADMDIPPQLLSTYIRKMIAEKRDCVIGSKTHERSILHQTWKRRLLSKVSRGIIDILFQLKGVDTQVGIKIFSRKCIKTVLDDVKAKSFAFDIELLVLIRHHGFEITSAPVFIDQTQTQSQVSSGSTMKTFMDTMAIHHRLKQNVRSDSWSYAAMRMCGLALLFLPLETALKMIGKV